MSSTGRARPDTSFGGTDGSGRTPPRPLGVEVVGAGSADAEVTLAAERRQRLAGLLAGSRARRVSELAREMGVSASTVRRDLSHLQARGLVVRVHGGAAASGQLVEALGQQPVEPALERARRAIAERAAARVPDGATIALLSGSATREMVPHLIGRRDLTVVTNGLDIAHALAHGDERVAVVVLGGLVDRGQMTMVGMLPEENSRALHVDTMFGGAWGVDAEVGATGPKVVQAAARHSLLAMADQLVVLAEAEKLGRRGPARLAEVHEIRAVITDDRADRAELDALRHAGVEVVVCA
jgi:DeoR/GlpR family transcriptional regulator of sugar metabolism